MLTLASCYPPRDNCIRQLPPRLHSSPATHHPCSAEKKSHGLVFCDMRFCEKLILWDNKRQSLTKAAAALATKGIVGAPRIQVQRASREQLAGPRPFSIPGSFREKLDEEDISSVFHDGGAEVRWLSPTMPQSVLEKSGYQQVSSTPRIGKA